MPDQSAVSVASASHPSAARRSTPHPPACADDPSAPHPAWLPDSAFAAVGSRRVLTAGEGLLVDTVRLEIAQATAAFSGTVADVPHDDTQPDLVLALLDHAPQTVADVASALREAEPLGEEGFVLARRAGTTVVLATHGAGLLAGMFHVVRLGESAFSADITPERHAPAHALRKLDHWDNIDVHPVMGQVERGYSGGSVFYADGGLRTDLSRVRGYARLLAASGINRVTINNVNVHASEALLLTRRLADVAALADVFRPYGIRTHLAVSFAAPILLGGMSTADPHDSTVASWWEQVTRTVHAAVPDFGGYVVKADSEGQPGPFSYGRDHADGANMLARALAPYGGVVHWRAFVYDNHQDWRDRSTDRARAAYDHFAPLDGRFDDNVVVQVKLGPIDFQVREPVSPVLAAMPRTRLAVELQVTQEYTGQQKHVCYLAPQWSEVMGFRPWGQDGPAVSDITTGAPSPDARRSVRDPHAGGGLAAVSNVGMDQFWTGHPLAQANLYAVGRLAWDPSLTPSAILAEWSALTFGADDPVVASTVQTMLTGSRDTYEAYTAPLGVGFMVHPGHHYGPGIDGYEYTPWGTYHFADRDGVGVDRTRASGTGYTGQYPQPWAAIYEDLDQCPDELLLFFHHVPYTHVLRSGSTVIQHIYDTHFSGVEQVDAMARSWSGLAGLVAPDVYDRVQERLEEQQRCAREWRDQVNTYFFRKSGVPDERGRQIF